MGSSGNRNLGCAVLRIGVVIPTLDKPVDAMECVRSVLSSNVDASSTLEVVVVDNSAGNDVVDALGGFAVRVVRPGLNVGVAGGRNYGLDYVEGCEVVVFVDHDVRLEPDCLSKLIGALVDRETVGIATPRVMYLDAPDQTWAAGTMINLRTGRVGFITKPPSDEPYEVDVAPSVIAVKRVVLRSIGGFDERYFATFEDTDFCIRARKKGFSTICVPQARAFHRTPVHKKDQSRHLLSRAHFVGRNRILFIRSHGTSLLAFGLMLPFYMGYYGWLSIRIGSGRAVSEFIAGTFAGVMEGWGTRFERVVPWSLLRQVSKALPREGLILDVGCGTGQTTSRLKGPGRVFVGVDIDATKMMQARTSDSYRGLVVASADRVPFRDGVFDASLAIEVIEHLEREESEECISELCRVASGTVVLTTPNGEGVTPGEAAENPFQLHRSQWHPIELSVRGFRVSGQGLRWSWGPSGAAASHGVLSVFARMLSLLTAPIISLLPHRAARILATRQDGELPQHLPKDPYVSVIIPVFNSGTFLDRCLQSVFATANRPVHVVVVDDGSTDGAIDRLEHQLEANGSPVQIIRTWGNQGAAAARNLGALQTDADILVLLDSDTEVSPGWLQAIIQPLLDDPSVGAATGVTLETEDPDKIQMAGVRLIPWCGWATANAQGASIAHARLERTNTMALSTFLAVRADAYRSIGGFDESLGIHTEDIDFCWRLWLQGNKIVLAPHARALHASKSVDFRAETMGSSKRQIDFVLARNSLRSMIKNLGVSRLLMYIPLALVIHLSKALINLRRGNRSSLNGFASAVVWNIRWLPDTLRHRSQTQLIRRVSDAILFSAVGEPNPLRSLLRMARSSTWKKS